MNKKKKLSPFFNIILSFLIIIILGSILLMMPFSTLPGIKNLTFVQAFFTSTSAVCVTGLTVIPNIGITLSLFGKIVLAVLIEIGGLGFITITIFVFVILGMKIGIKNRFLLKEALNQDTPHGMVKLVKSIVLTAFLIQVLGIICNFLIIKFTFDMPWNNVEILGYSAFHTISSFNNAGFDLFGDSSLINFSSNILFNLSTAALIIVGGIGFIVIFDIFSNFRWRKLNIHTKIVLLTSLSLIVVGTLLFKLLTKMNWLESYFQSVSARTAGFTTYPMSALKDNPAFIVMIILMFIGASPCSTGGGLKTTTLFVLISSIISYATGKKAVIFNREISRNSIIKAFTLFVLATIFTIFIAFIISIIESIGPTGILTNINDNFNFSDIIFECFSAFGTVGNSTGVTSYLHWTSQLLVCVLMFFGRLGPLTIMNLWNRNWLVDNNDELRYVEKNIIIG